MSRTVEEYQSIILTAPKTLQLEKRKLPENVAPDEVLIKINSVGVCGSDMHFYVHQGFAGNKLKNPKQILGHEGGGTVVKVGANVTHVQVGDRVAIEPNIPCMRCRYCVEGRNNLCINCLETFDPPNEGLFQQFYLQPSFLVHKLADNLSFEEAAIAEPLSCALHAVKRASVGPGDNVLVTGAGAIGLLCLSGAKCFGANKVIVTDIVKSKTDYAVKIGATNGYVSNKDTPISEQAAAIRTLFGGVDPDVTLECTGFESAVCLALESTRKGGRVALVGLGQMRVNVPLSATSLKELDIFGCSKSGNWYQPALKLMANGQIDASKVVTHRFPLDKYQEAFDLMAAGMAGKVLIQFE